jgi:sterol desaturase/sphingolipid hydroxylase (fatty acid hydroxylase superfamily)
MRQWLFNQLSEQFSAVVFYLAPSILAGCVVFTAIDFFPGNSCNPEKRWWRNRGLTLDLSYSLLTSFCAPFLSHGAAILIALVLAIFLPFDAIVGLQRGRGPLAGLPFALQCVLYLLLTDFLLYWIHRLFHGRLLWPFHAIHHAPEEVDWTTVYRMHPVNAFLGAYLVLNLAPFLGIPIEAIMLLGPLDIALGYFVHANLNWTLGPLKYLIATPVFHRWHHTRPDQGGNANFAPSFAIWDVIFGTFYMPPNELPRRYGVDETDFPRGFMSQLAHPFKALLRRRARAPRSARSAGSAP